MRLRLLIRDAEGADTDIDEAAAREIFESAAARDTRSLKQRHRLARFWA